jgi:hypothetical protein
MYTAAVLTPNSQQLLKNLIGELVPNSFEWIGHHLTLHMGPARPEDNLGATVRLVVSHFAKDERVCAVKVCVGGEISSNAQPHVTCAVNREGGGKPKDSNGLAEWIPLGELIDLSFITLIAKVEECK